MGGGRRSGPTSTAAHRVRGLGVVHRKLHQPVGDLVGGRCHRTWPSAPSPRWCGGSARWGFWPALAVGGLQLDVALVAVVVHDAAVRLGLAAVGAVAADADLAVAVGAQVRLEQLGGLGDLRLGLEAVAAAEGAAHLDEQHALDLAADHARRGGLPDVEAHETSGPAGIRIVGQVPHRRQVRRAAAQAAVARRVDEAVAPLLRHVGDAPQVLDARRVAAAAGAAVHEAVVDQRGARDILARLGAVPARHAVRADEGGRRAVLREEDGDGRRRVLERGGGRQHEDAVEDERQDDGGVVVEEDARAVRPNASKC